jgi:hypothetical protein
MLPQMEERKDDEDKLSGIERWCISRELHWCWHCWPAVQVRMRHSEHSRLRLQRKALKRLPIRHSSLRLPLQAAATRTEQAAADAKAGADRAESIASKTDAPR